MTAGETPVSPPVSGGVRRALRWLLGAQIVVALLLLTLDLAPSIPGLLQPSQAPALDQPTRPGDQTRQYQPGDPWLSVPASSGDMPRRLQTAPVFLENGDTALQLRGAIAPGDGQKMVALLEQQAPGIVLLDSPGGSVDDALDIGRALRRLDIDTRLFEDAVCFSACPYVFAGGVERRIDANARFGVHQHSFGQSRLLPAFLAVEDVQRGQAMVLAHLEQMGLDLGIMGPAMATPANEIYILSSEELQQWRVVTE